jgi:hypothetical protein
MSFKKGRRVALILLSVAISWGCNSSSETGGLPANPPANANAETAKKALRPDADGFLPSGTGTEKEKPAPGTANVQGKALYNGQPAAGVEVKLCEKFNRFLGGCGGQTFTAQTDAAGEYLIKDAPPGDYEGLIVKVFDTDYYIFATSGVVSSAKYRLEEGRTFFAPDTNLYKQDLKLTNPKAGSKVAPSGIEVKWEQYPDAAYYKLSVHADSSSGAKADYDYINRRVDGLSFPLDKPLAPGTYTVRVEAYNGADNKLSQSPNDIKFTVAGDAPK